MYRLYKKKIKFGILGGTFDPPHFGHLTISKIALKKFRLKKIFWIITKQNPLKTKPKYNLKNRIRLSKKILNKESKIQIKKLNQKLNSANTFTMLNFLKSNNKRTKFLFLMGADNLINFHKWKNWKKIPALAKIVVFARPGFSSRALGSVAAKKLKKQDWIYIKFTKLNISSSKLKKI